MKKLIVFIMLILTLGVLSVSAADVAVTNSFSVSSPTLGSANQRASNPNHDTPSLREVFTDANGALPITNNGVGSHTMTGVKFISSSRGFVSTDLNFSIVGGPKTVAAGTSDTITLNARIPQGLDAVDSNLQETGFDVAVVAFVNASGTEVSDQFTVFMRRENNLELDDIDVTILSPGGGRDTNSVSDTDDDIEGVKPGDDIEVKIDVENTFSNSEDVDIEDVDARVSIDTSDFDEDEDDNVGDVSADDTSSASLRFEVDEDAEDDTGDIVFEVDGEDEFGARHGERLTVDFEIERDNHDILVQGLSVTPGVVDCQDTSVQASVDILNLGKSDEDDVAVEVSSRTLNYEKRISNIELDENDGDIEVFDVTFPKNLASGVYALEVQTYYDGSHLSNTEVAQFESVCGKLSEQPATGTTTKAALTLSQSAVSLKRSGVASVGLQVTNTDTATKQFTVRINGAEDFAESFSPKTLTLGAGQSSNVFFNLKGKNDADEGTYTAQVVVESGSQVVDAETLTVRVEGQATSTTGATTASVFGGLSSTTLWVIGDIVLIGLAIAFIWMIFGGKRKPTPI